MKWFKAGQLKMGWGEDMKDERDVILTVPKHIKKTNKQKVALFFRTHIKKKNTQHLKYFLYN